MEYIYIKNNFLSSQVCNMLIKYFESNEQDHFDGYFSASKIIDHSFKKCSEMHVS